jgi:hypothetical protein
MGIRRSVLLVVIKALVTFAVAYPMLRHSYRPNYPIEGVHQVRLVQRCVLVLYNPLAQPFKTVTIDCPGKDSVRIWPLPVLDPRNEDW